METTGKQQEERNGSNGEKMKMSQFKDADKLTFLWIVSVLQPPVAEEDDLSSSSCNILLYFGLGLMCVGSVIAFVGEDQTLLERDGRRLSDQSFYSKGTFLGLKEVHTWRMLENSSKIKLQTFPIFLISGVGDKGYQTLELRLVGPILAVTGALLVCCRVLMCFIVIIQYLSNGCRDMKCVSLKFILRVLSDIETSYSTVTKESLFSMFM